MNRQAIVVFALGAPLLCLGQQQRPLYPHELIGEEVPSSVTSIQDRDQIRAFIDERSAMWDEFMERAKSACPQLLDGSMTPEQFAGHLDAEDGVADEAIRTAYDRLRSRLSDVGLVELDTEGAQYFGYGIEQTSVERLASDYVNVSLLYRYRCLQGFPDVDERTRSVAMGPSATAGESASGGHPDPNVRVVSP